MPDMLPLAFINTELRKHSYTSKRYLVPGQKCSCEWDVIGIEAGNEVTGCYSH